MPKTISKQAAFDELKKRYAKAENLLNDDAKVETFLTKLERKIKWIPFISKELKSVPTLIGMLRSYWKKDYTKVPFKTMVAIVSALLYFLSPLDVVPDWIPILGQLDDALVIGTCWKLVSDDIEAYRKWKAKQGKAKH
ncbi:YkvA family protein [Streptococcus merionis]|uniref:YkvA family protein n=1 Tax=Streptococcus merionis TaxID=400065 RepID=UPI0026F0C076|nr:YkvA family protein [Streptococcus merionis]